MTPNRFLRTPSLPVRLPNLMVHLKTLPSLEMLTTFLLTVPEVVCRHSVPLTSNATANLRLAQPLPGTRLLLFGVAERHHSNAAASLEISRGASRRVRTTLQLMVLMKAIFYSNGPAPGGGPGRAGRSLLRLKCSCLAYTGSASPPTK